VASFGYVSKMSFHCENPFTKISMTYFRDGFSFVYRLGAALQQDTESGTQSRCLQTGDRLFSNGLSNT